MVKGQQRAVTEKVPQASYFSLFPCREVNWFLVDCEHSVIICPVPDILKLVREEVMVVCA